MATQYPGWKAGQKITAKRISDSLPQFVSKMTSTDRLNATTLTDDPDLWFDVEAGAIYIVEFKLFMGGDAGVNPVTQWRVPAGSDGLKGVFGPGSGATDDNNILMRSGSHQFGTDVTYGYRDGHFDYLQGISENGTVYTTQAGQIAIQWGADVSSSTTAVRMGTSSWARCTRVA